MLEEMKETRDILIRNGRNLFWQRGYNGTGIQEITNSAKVSKGSFYNHFKHKELFAEELVEDFAKTLKEEYKEALLQGEGSPLYRLRAFYEKKIEAVEVIDQFKRGCVVSNLCQEVADKYDGLAQVIDEAFQNMAEPIKLCLDQAKEIGELEKGKDSEMMAEMILNSWNGALMRVKASKNTKAMKAFMELLELILR